MNQATAPSDYAAASGHLDFAPGETARTLTVTVNGDITPELDETFFVNFTSTTNAGFGDGSGTGTILDDDSPGKFSFSAAQYSATEGQQVVVKILRTNGTSGTVAVDYQTATGGNATANADFTPVSGTLIFGGGENGFRCSAVCDRRVELHDHEQFVRFLFGQQSSAGRAIRGRAREKRRRKRHYGV